MRAMIYHIPLWLFWTVGWISFVFGAVILLAGDGFVRGMRRWLLWQLKRLRRPLYRRFLRIYGWLLLVLGTLMIVLLSSFCFPR